MIAEGDRLGTVRQLQLTKRGQTDQQAIGIVKRNRFNPAIRTRIR